METGIYGNNKPNLPLFFDKFRSNNIHINPETTHQTPNGAGMTTMATDKVLIQPTITTINNEKT